VILPDARNHGRSPHLPQHTYRELASDLRAFLVDRRLEDVILVGHSMGARTVLFLSLVDPDCGVNAGVSVDASPVHPTPEDGVRKLHTFLKGLQGIDLGKVSSSLSLSKARPEVDKMLREREEGFATLERQWMTQALTKDSNGELAWKFNLKALSANLESEMLTVPEKIHWQTFEKPFLFVGAQLSGYIGHERHDAISEWFPKAQFGYVPDAGHYVHVDNPDGFLQVVLPFLKDLD